MYSNFVCLFFNLDKQSKNVQDYTLSGDTVVCCFSFEVKACRGGGGREGGREWRGRVINVFLQERRMGAYRGIMVF